MKWILTASLFICFFVLTQSCKTRRVDAGYQNSTLMSVTTLKYRFGAGMRSVSGVQADISTMPGFHTVVDGLKIGKIVGGGAADECGFEVGDVVTKLNGRSVTTPEGWDEIIEDLTRPEVKITYVRSRSLSEKNCILSSDEEESETSAEPTQNPNSSNDIIKDIALNATKDSPNLLSSTERTLRAFTPDICNKGSHQIYIADDLKPRMDIVRKIRIQYCLLVVGKLEM